MTIGGAIAELQNLINADDVPFYYKGGIEKVIETISMELPSRAEGEWELVSDNDGEYGICSLCGNDADFTHYGKSYNYCPNCGAKMKGTDNGTVKSKSE